MLNSHHRRILDFFNFCLWACACKKKSKDCLISTCSALVRLMSALSIIPSLPTCYFSGASKLSLSTISSEDLWKRTGRLDGSSSEASSTLNHACSVAQARTFLTSRSQLFRLRDRKGGKYLLSPTHEEEITFLVGSIVRSYKELPLRLYQICSFSCLRSEAFIS